LFLVRRRFLTGERQLPYREKRKKTTFPISEGRAFPLKPFPQFVILKGKLSLQDLGNVAEQWSNKRFMGLKSACALQAL